MKRFLIPVLCLGLAGCAGTGQLTHANGEGEKFYRVTDFSSAYAAAPGYTITILELCTSSTTDCQEITVNHTASTGIFTSIAGPVITGAAVVGGAYFLGEGIANSGNRINSTVNQDGAGSSSNTTVEGSSVNTSVEANSGADSSSSASAQSGATAGSSSSSSSSSSSNSDSSSSGGGGSCHGNCPGFGAGSIHYEDSGQPEKSGEADAKGSVNKNSI